MDINRKNLDTMFEGYQTQFITGMGMAPNTWQSFAGVVPSGAAGNIYPFLENHGGMREWIGERQIKHLSSNKLTVLNRKFEDTTAVGEDDIEDDSYGLYGSVIAQMGLNAEKLWNDLSYETLVDSTGKWLDGKTFYATDRKYGKNTICNKCTAALSSTTFNTAYNTMLAYAGHNGKAIGVIPSLLIVGPKLRTAAWDIVKNEFSYSAADKVQVKNANNGLVDLLVVSELSGDYDDYWFLGATKGVIKPVMVQQRKKPVLTRQDKEDSDSVFNRGEYVYGTKARGEAFKSMPHLLYAGIL